MNALVFFIIVAVLVMAGMSFFIKDIAKAQSEYIEKVKKVVVGSRWESRDSLENHCDDFPKQVAEVTAISYDSEGNEFVEYKYGELTETIQLEFFISSFTEILNK